MISVDAVLDLASESERSCSYSYSTCSIMFNLLGMCVWPIRSVMSQSGDAKTAVVVGVPAPKQPLQCSNAACMHTAAADAWLSVHAGHKIDFSSNRILLF